MAFPPLKCIQRKIFLLKFSLRITDNSTCRSAVCWSEYLIYSMWMHIQHAFVSAEARWNNHVWRWKKVKHLQGWCRSVWQSSKSNPLRPHADGKGNYTTPWSSGVRFSPFISMFGRKKKKKNTGDWLNLAVNYRSRSTVSPGVARFNCSVPHTDVATRRLGTRVSFDEHLHATRSANALQSRICRPAPHCLRHLHLI